MRPMRSVLTLALATALAIMAAPTAVAGPISDAWWSTAEACTPVRDTLHDNDAVDDGDTNWTHQQYEYDPLKKHSCGELRDDLQEEAYEPVFDAVGEPSLWYCNSSYTFWKNCVGVNHGDGDCDILWTHLSYTCIGGVFPHDK